MFTCDWWGAIAMAVYCAVATLTGCWAIDHFTGVKAALERSKKWEKGNLSLAQKEEKDDEVSDRNS